MRELSAGFSKLRGDDLFCLGTTVVNGEGANLKSAGLNTRLPPITAAGALQFASAGQHDSLWSDLASAMVM